MITLLSKIFISKETLQNPEALRQKYGILCGATGIFLNLLLFAGKFFAGLLSNSIAITADAFNNLSDAGSSIITLFGFKMAGQKPDHDHPFGHGRIEYISALLVSIVILYMGIELIKSSFDKILHPQELTFSPMILAILLASILVKFYMAFFNYRIGHRIDSSAMTATATDSLSDTISTAVVLGATVVSHYTDFIIDGYCGLIVGILVLYAGIKSAKDTVSPLLGQAPDPDFVQQISDIVMSYEGVIGIHDLIVHNYGPGRFLISLHAEVPSDGDLLTMHDMIDLIEHQLQETLLCSAVIHMDPVCVSDEETNQLKSQVAGYLKDIDASLSMHDFRIVKGPTHTNIIFDVVTPYHFKLSDAALKAEINERIRRENPMHFAVIEVDKKYT